MSLVLDLVLLFGVGLLIGVLVIVVFLLMLSEEVEVKIKIFYVGNLFYCVNEGVVCVLFEE